MKMPLAAVHESAYGTEQTYEASSRMSALSGEADVMCSL
jgi:hypothetical protein